MKINGAILDRVHKSLDPEIWDLEQDPPVLKDEVKEEILGRLFEFLRKRGFYRFDLWIKNIFLIGSMVTLQYKENSDLDITVIVSRSELQKLHKEENIFDLLKEALHDVSGEFYNKTLHVINYFLVEAPARIDADAIYDIVADRWIKFYPQLSEDFNPDEAFRDLKQKAEEIMQWIDVSFMNIRRELVDIQNLQDLLREFDREGQERILNEIRKKIIKIEEEIFALTSLHTELIEARDKAFRLDKFDDSGFFAYKFSRNWLPPNIIYKFLERYNYIDLLRKMQALIKEGFLDIEKAKDMVKERIV